MFLDLRPIAGLQRRFPTVYAACLRHGLDPGEQPVPISPAAHYHVGGIAIDAHGPSSLPSLWARGEVACAGVHSANRLGGPGREQLMRELRRLMWDPVSLIRDARGLAEVYERPCVLADDAGPGESGPSSWPGSSRPQRSPDARAEAPTSGPSSP